MDYDAIFDIVIQGFFFGFGGVLILGFAGWSINKLFRLFQSIIEWRG